MLNWDKDPEFSALPAERKSIIYQNYFDKELADDEFRALPQPRQAKIKENFLKEQGSGYEPVKIDSIIRKPSMGETVKSFMDGPQKDSTQGEISFAMPQATPIQVDQKYTEQEDAGPSTSNDKKNILAYAPYLAVEAIKGATDTFGYNKAMKAIGLDSGKTLDTAIEYWKEKLPSLGNIPNAGIGFDDNGKLGINRLPDVPVSDILGATAGGVGFLGAATPAFMAGSLVASQAAKYARPFYQSILKGMVAGSLLGEGEKDKTLEHMAMFGIFEGAGYAISKIPSAIKAIKGSANYAKATIKDKGISIEAMEIFLKGNPNAPIKDTVKHFQDVTDAITAIKDSKLYRKLDSLTVQERGLAVQTMQEVFDRNPNMSRGEKARLFDSIYKKEFEKRTTGEPDTTQPGTPPEPPITPQPPKSTEPKQIKPPPPKDAEFINTITDKLNTRDLTTDQLLELKEMPDFSHLSKEIDKVISDYQADPITDLQETQRVRKNLEAMKKRTPAQEEKLSGLIQKEEELSNHPTILAERQAQVDQEKSDLERKIGNLEKLSKDKKAKAKVAEYKKRLKEISTTPEERQTEAEIKKQEAEKVIADKKAAKQAAIDAEIAKTNALADEAIEKDINPFDLIQREKLTTKEFKALQAEVELRQAELTPPDVSTQAAGSEKAPAIQPTEPLPAKADTGTPEGQKLSKSKVVSYIDSISKGDLNLKSVKEKVNQSDVFEKTTIPIDEIKVGDISDIKETDIPKADLSNPIVIDKDGTVIDGRHRVLKAKKDGLKEVSVLKPFAKADTGTQEGVEGEPTPLEILTLSEKEITTKYPEYSKRQEAQKKKDEQPVKEIDSAIKVFQTELKDWESREYKDNKTKVSVGGTQDDLQSGETSIGAANERRRKRNIESRQQSIVELEKAKERLNKGEDEKQILGELLDSQYLPLVDFARKRLGMKPSTPAPEIGTGEKTKPQLPADRVIKEPWEMTKAEWVKEQGKRVSGQSVPKTEKLAKSLHKNFVKIWIKEGRPISEAVKKDYPELFKADGKQAPKAEAKEPWQNSDLATKPNIPESKVKSRMLSPKNFVLEYVGTRNEVFPGERFKNPQAAKKFFRVQKLKAMKNSKAKTKEAPRKIYKTDGGAVVAINKAGQGRTHEVISTPEGYVISPREETISDQEFQEQVEKINRMKIEMENSATVGFTGVTLGNEMDEGKKYSSSRPEWMVRLNKSRAKARREALGEDEITVVFDKLLKGELFTQIQLDDVTDIENAIRKYEGETGEFQDFSHITELEKRGFDILGDQSVVIEDSSLDDGVIFTGQVDGKYDEWTVSGVDDNLNVTFIGKERGKAVAKFTDSVIIEAIKYGNVDGENIVEEAGSLFDKKEELFSGGKEIVKPKLQKSKKKKSKTDKLQGDLFTGMPVKEDQGDLFEYKPEQLEKVKFEGLREKQTISTKSISRVDISKSGFVVRTIDDAASLLSHIGDEASENAYFLSLDKDGNVLEVLRHTIGTKSSSLIDPTEAIGRSFNIPGTDRIVFAHNHPAVTFKPSKSDKAILKRLEAISKLRNIEITPMLIGMDEYVVFDINSGEQAGNPIKNTIKKADVPIKERVFEKRVGKNDPVYKQVPETAKRLKGEGDGFLLLDGANKEVGFLPFPSGLAQKEITARVIAATQKTGAGAIIVNNKPPANATGRDDFLKKLSDALLKNNIVIFDIFSYDKDGVVSHDPQDVRREPYYSLSAVDKDTVQFQTNKDTQPGQGLTPKQIQAEFPGTKTTVSPEGEIIIRFPNGQGVRILSTKAMPDGMVQYAVSAGRMSEKGTILGATVGNTIYLDLDLTGTGTVNHEQIHALKNMGMIRQTDENLLMSEFYRLKRRGELDVAPNKDVDENLSDAENKAKQRDENIANIFAQVKNDRKKYRGTRLGRIIQKIMDFLDGLLNIGKMTLRKLAKEAESGKIFSRATDGKKPGIVNIGKGKAWGIQVNKEFQVDTWHGSPHYIEGEFRNEAIGTGEGAQAFGWGHYVSESKGVAKSYSEMGRRKGQTKLQNANRDKLSQLIINNYSSLLTDPEIKQFLKSEHFDKLFGRIETAIKFVNKNKLTNTRYTEDSIKRAFEWGFGDYIDIDNKSLKDRLTIKEYAEIKVTKAYDITDKLISALTKKKRHLYKTTLHKGKTPDDYNYLEWSEGMTDVQFDQIEKAMQDEGLPVFEILRPVRMKDGKMMGNGWVSKKYREQHLEEGSTFNYPTGNKLYYELNQFLGSPKAASEFLLKAGISGIKYPAGTLSGGNKSGAYNYVVFDPKDITIEEHIQFDKAAEQWYSALTNAVDSVKQKAMPAQQWKALLGSSKFKQMGVKADELYWSGILNELDKRKGKVTKQEVLDYLAENNVRVEEVVKGYNRISSSENLKAINKMLAAGFDIKEYEDGSIGVKEKEKHIFPDGSEGRPQFVNREDLPEALLESFDIITKYSDQQADEYYDYDSDSDTKFSDYLSPWNISDVEGYKEILMTLPEKKSKFDPLKVKIKRNKQSVTQGTTSIFYGNDEMATYSDDPKLIDGEYKQKPESYFINVAEELFNKGDSFNNIKARGDNYTSTHYPDDPNILVHMRIGERMVDGKRALHVFEIQSDMHQEGRKKGYKGEGAIEAKKQFDAYSNKLAKKYNLNPAHNIAMYGTIKNIGKDEIAEYERLQKEWIATKEGVPNAPFKESKKWAMLAMKRLVRLASENNFDMIVIDPGALQVQRYKEALRKAVDKVEWTKTQDGIRLVGHKNGKQVVDTVEKENSISDAIGKTMGESIINDPNQSGVIEGDDITISDTGMAGFYDVILPAEINKFFNKKAWGNAKVELEGVEVGKVSRRPKGMYEAHFEAAKDFKNNGYSKAETLKEMQIAYPDAGKADISEAVNFVYEDKIKLHKLQITPEMKSKSLRQGMPLFSTKEPTNILSKAFKKWFGESVVKNEDGSPVVLYHGSNAGFNVFKPSKNGRAGEGIYFTPYESEAMQYGKNIIPAYISIQNPRVMKRKDIPLNSKNFRSNTENLGYDGIIVKNESGEIDEIVAFKSNQIKSVYNSGEWNPQNPDIRFQTTEDFLKEWRKKHPKEEKKAPAGMADTGGLKEQKSISIKPDNSIEQSKPKRPFITETQKKAKEKAKNIKITQLNIETAKEAKEAVATMIRKRRYSLNLSSYETNAFINSIEQVTTKTQREILPFIIEKTGVPKELNRPDLEKSYAKSGNDLSDIALQVKGHFNKGWRKMQRHIPDMSAQEIENYVTHIWNIPKGKKQEITNWFTTKNRFLKQRFIETLEKGIVELGLKPKVLDISEIIRIHDAVANRAIENAKFVDGLKRLKKDGVSLIERSDKAPQDWVMIDHPALRRALVIPGDLKMGEKVSPALTDLLHEMGVAIGRRINPTAWGNPIKHEGLYKPGDPPEVRFKRFMSNKTIAHEIGHHIDATMGLNETFLQQHKTELYALNKDRIETTGLKKSYTTSASEQIAEAFAFLFTDPVKMKKIAPNTMADMLERLSQDGTLSKLIDFDFEKNAKNLIEEQLNTMVQLPIKVHPDLAAPLNVIFESRFNHPLINAYELVNGIFKKTSLSFSLFHHLALGETGVATTNPVSVAGIYFNPVKIYNALVKGQYDVFKKESIAKDAISHGLQLGATSDIPVQMIQKHLNEIANKTKNVLLLNKITGFVRTFNETWDKALWDYLHDTLKLYAYESLSSKLKTGSDLSKQKEEVAQLVNDTFGGQNWDVLMVSPKTIQIMTWGLLSADWTTSTLRQALSPTGIGSIHKETKKLRRKMGRMFWLKAGLYFGVGINLLNIVMRKEDRKENPEYYKGIEDSLINNTMYGNAIGKKSNLFAGRYEDGSERYIRWGKQFRELPEMFMDDTGFSPVSASLKKIGGKAAPVMQLTSQVFTGQTLSGFKNDDIYGKKGWDKTYGIFKTLLKAPLPFSSRSLLTPGKEFYITDIAMPSSKGMSRYRAMDLFKTSMVKQDERLLEEIYQDVLMNNLPAYTLFNAALTSLKAEETREYNKGMKTLKDLESLPKTNNPEDAKRIVRKTLRLTKELFDKEIGLGYLDKAISDLKLYNIEQKDFQ